MIDFSGMSPGRRWAINNGFEITDEGDIQSDGEFVAAICQACGLVEASGCTCNMGTNQPEYCRC